MEKNYKSAFTVLELILTTVMMAVVLVITPIIVLKKSTKGIKISHDGQNLFFCTSKCLFSIQESNLIRMEHNYDTQKDELSVTHIVNRHKNRDDEPYQITLFGGGGGGSNSSYGMHGHFENGSIFLSLDKNSTYQAADVSRMEGILTGYYLFEPGKGGEISQSGESSQVCSLSSDVINEFNSNGDREGSFNNLNCNMEGAKILIQAAGGLSSNEKIDNSSNSTNVERFCMDSRGASNNIPAEEQNHYLDQCSPKVDTSAESVDKQTRCPENSGDGGNKGESGIGGCISIK